MVINYIFVVEYSMKLFMDKNFYIFDKNKNWPGKRSIKKPIHIFSVTKTRRLPLLPHLDTAVLSEKFEAVFVGTPKGDLVTADWLGVTEVRTAPSSPLTTTRGGLPFAPNPFDLKIILFPQ